MKWKAWVIVAALVLVVALFWFWRGGRGRILADNKLARAVIVGVAPDGRLAVFGEEGLVLLDHRKRSASRGTGEFGFTGLTALGSNGYAVSSHPFGSEARLRMFNWKGEELWTYRSVPALGPPARDAADNLYLFDGNGILHSLDPGGRLRWSHLEPANSFTFAPPAVSADGRVALFEKKSGGVVLLDSAGNVLWRYDAIQGSAQNSVTILRDSGDLLVRDEQTLRRLDREGRLLWELDLSTKVEPPGLKARTYRSPMIGPDGTIYCPFANWLVAVAPNGEWKWNHQTAEAVANVSMGSAEDWATFTRAGELVFIAGELNALHGPATAGAGSQVAIVARNEGLRCLGPDGTLKWEQSIPSSFSWQVPFSRWDLQVIWESRMGLRTSKQLNRLTRTPDGTLYVSGWVNNKTRIWAIRGD